MGWEEAQVSWEKAPLALCWSSQQSGQEGPEPRGAEEQPHKQSPGGSTLQVSGSNQGTCQQASDSSGCWGQRWSCGTHCSISCPHPCSRRAMAPRRGWVPGLCSRQGWGPHRHSNNIWSMASPTFPTASSLRFQPLFI